MNSLWARQSGRFCETTHIRCAGGIQMAGMSGQVRNRIDCITRGNPSQRNYVTHISPSIRESFIVSECLTNREWTSHKPRRSAMDSVGRGRHPTRATSPAFQCRLRPAALARGVDLDLRQWNTIIQQVLRSPLRIIQSELARIDTEVVVQSREDIFVMHRT